MIAAEVTGADVLMLVTIGVLLLVLVFLAMAEMGLSKMTKPRAAALRGALGVAGGLATYGGALLADHAGLICGT